MQLRHFIYLLLLIVLIGCTADLAEPVAETTPEPTETATAQVLAEAVATVTPTLTPSPTETMVPTASPTYSLHNEMTMTPTPGSIPTQTRTPFVTGYSDEEALAPPVGLLFRLPDGQNYLVNADGEPEPVGAPGDRISADGLYSLSGFSATELATGEVVTFYEGDGFLRAYWPENPEWVLLALFADADWGCYSSCGTPALARLDGSELILLVDEIGVEHQLTSPVALGPAGTQLAYVVAEQAYLFDFENGIQPLEVTSLGLDESSWLSHPSYSPAGDLIAWAYYSPTEDGRFAENSGVIITTATGEFVSSIVGYQMWGLDGGFYPPSWSADSNYLAFQGSAVEGSLFGTFILNVVTNEVEASFGGYYPFFTSQRLYVQDFDRVPGAYVARGSGGNFWTNIDLFEINRAMPFPIEDVTSNLIYLPDADGQIWAIDQRSINAIRVALPMGTQLIGFVNR